MRALLLCGAALLAASMCAPSAHAAGDARLDRIHALWGAVLSPGPDLDASRAEALAEEIVALERQASPLDPLGLAEALRLLAGLRSARQDLAGAEASLLEAHALYSERLGPLNPLSGELLALLARVELAKGDRRRSALAMDRALELLPPGALPHAMVCFEVYEGVDELDKARRCLEIAWRAAPGDFHVANNLAWVLLTAPRSTPADWKWAEELARTSVEAQPGFVPAEDTLGLALVRVGRAREAREILSRALEREPSGFDDTVRPFLELHLAMALEAIGDADGAAALARSALGRDGSEFDRSEAEALLARLAPRLPAQSGRLADAP